jgi:hypothetical protein
VGEGKRQSIFVIPRFLPLSFVFQIFSHDNGGSLTLHTREKEQSSNDCRLNVAFVGLLVGYGVLVVTRKEGVANKGTCCPAEIGISNAPGYALPSKSPGAVIYCHTIVRNSGPFVVVGLL